MKLAVFETHPVQYRAPVYRELELLLSKKKGSSLHVYYATDVNTKGFFDEGFKKLFAWDEDLLQGYDATVLNTAKGKALSGFNSLTGKGIWKLLRKEKPDAVMITTHAHRYEWSVIFSAIMLGIPIWIRTETQDHAFRRSRLKSVFRALFYRSFYKRVQKAFAIGKLSKEHLLTHGIPLSAISFSRYCVVDRFGAIDDGEKERLRSNLRKDLGITADKTLLMFCGKLQDKKNPKVILDALAMLKAEEKEKYAVLYVGSGDLEGALRVAGLSVGAPVCFAGFKNQLEIAPYYLAADVLILPSRQMGETWGLVVNEALLAERRVVISQFVGCSAEFKDLPSVKVFDGTTIGLAGVLRCLPAPESVKGQRQFMKSYSVVSAAEGIFAEMVES